MQIDRLSENYSIAKFGFNKLINKIIKYETTIFARPVYWYSMSGSMKILFDRFTDLITIKKELGRKLKGKSILLFVVGVDPEMPEGFEIPFKSTAQYLDLKYKGYIYFNSQKDIIIKKKDIIIKKKDIINQFLNKIRE